MLFWGCFGYLRVVWAILRSLHYFGKFCVFLELGHCTISAACLICVISTFWTTCAVWVLRYFAFFVTDFMEFLGVISTHLAAKFPAQNY